MLVLKTDEWGQEPMNVSGLLEDGNGKEVDVALGIQEKTESGRLSVSPVWPVLDSFCRTVRR